MVLWTWIYFIILWIIITILFGCWQGLILLYVVCTHDTILFFVYIYLNNGLPFGLIICEKWRVFTTNIRANLLSY